MQGNGFLIFIISATALWIIGKGFGPNVGPAWNVLTGASKTATATSPATSGGGLFQTAGIPSFPSYGAPSSSSPIVPGSPMSGSYQPPAIPYLGVSIA